MGFPGLTRFFFALLVAAAAVQTARSQVTNPIQCTATAAVPSVVRAEGAAELLGDTVLDCTGGVAGQSASINLAVYLNVSNANRILNASTGLSDAVLLIDEPAGGAAILNSNLFQGIANGNQVLFQSIPFVQPGTSHKILRITNLRGNILGANPPVQAYLAISGSIPVPINNPNVTVAFVSPGMTGAVQAGDGSSAAFNYQRCHGQNTALAANPYAAGGAVNFNLKFTEGFPTAFRKAIAGSDQSQPGALYNTETGYYNPSYPTIGGGAKGTRLVARFEGIPSGVSLYATVVPIPSPLVSSPGLQARMTSTDWAGDGAYSPVPATSAVSILSQPVQIAPVPISGGAATVAWEVLEASAISTEFASFGIVLAYNDNAPALGAARVSLALGPNTGPGISLPQFIDIAPPVDAFSIQECTPCNSAITPYAIGDGAPVSIKSTSFPAGATTGTVTVSATPGCAWIAASNSPSWLTVTQGASGSGNGAVQFTASANNTGNQRQGTITIAGQYLTVWQRPPTLSVLNGATNTPDGVVSPGELVFVNSPVRTGPVTAAAPANIGGGATLPTTLGSTRILFDGVPAPLEWMSYYGGVAVVPYGVAGRSSTLVEIEYNGIKRDMVQLVVSPVTPAVFNYGNPQVQLYLPPGLNYWDPIQRGTAVSVLVTGAGQTNPPGIDGRIYASSETLPSITAAVTVTVGGVPAQLLSATVAPFDHNAPSAGAYELRFVIPPAGPTGSAVPLGVTIGGVAAPAPGSINIASVSTCSVWFFENARSVGAGAGSGVANVNASPGCYWTATSNVNWLIPTVASGTGPGPAGFSIAANNSLQPRTGTLTIGGQTFTVNQAAASPVACFQLQPAQAGIVWFDRVDYISAVNSASDMLIVGRMPMDKFSQISSSLPVPTAANQRFCGQIPIAPGYLADAYVPTIPERLGDFSPFAGVLLDPATAHAVNGGIVMNPFPGGIIPANRLPDPMAWRIGSFSACSVTTALGGDTSTVAAAGAARSLSVSAGNSTCGWAAMTTATWITFPSGNTGLGSRTVSYTVAANTGASPRTAQITVAGQTFTVTQAGTGLQAGITADFNGDGRADVIWQDPVTGAAQIWYLGGPQGANIVGAAGLTAGNTWRIAGVGDFNGDGHPDVVWQDPVSGTAQVWLLGGSGGNIITGAAPLSGPNSWRIRVVADFNGDTHPDVIWQDPVSGWAQIWFLGGPQGTTITGAAHLAAGNTWRIAGAGDFNRDGKMDVLWQDPVSGAAQIWYLGGPQGNTIVDAMTLTLANAWSIAAVGDFNGDSYPDAVWQDPATGMSQVWTLGGAKGATITGAAPLSGPNSWRIMTPR